MSTLMNIIQLSCRPQGLLAALPRCEAHACPSQSIKACYDKRLHPMLHSGEIPSSDAQLEAKLEEGARRF